MEQPPSLAIPGPVPLRTPAKGIILSVLIGIIMAGAPPMLSYLFRPSTWLIWVAILGIVFLFSRELPLWELMRPVAPYLAWLLFYLAWALIVSPRTDIGYAVKVVVSTLILGSCMAILTAEPHLLRTWANAVQFAIIANFLVLLLMTRYPGFAALVQSRSLSMGAYEFGVSRFGGLWGNPNNAGYICLVATILSVLATPWIAYLGRLSCLPLLYLGVSRKSVILYLLILLYYLVAVRGRSIKFWFVAAGAVISMAFALVLSDGLSSKVSSVEGNATVSRLLDVKEKETSQRGGETRLDLLNQWVRAIEAEPWYGYGLRAMTGTLYDENDPQKVVQKGVFPLGTHNTYLGILVEIGPIGLAAFVIMLVHYMRLCLFAGGDPLSKWVLVSLMLVNLTMLFVSHDHLFSFEGETSFALLFILPSCAGLPRLTRTLN